MLWYLHLLSVNKIVATSYVDAPTAKLHVEPNGDGRFTEATLNPTVTITDASQTETALRLHQEAHKKCYIACSINFKVHINPTIKIA
jgi:organic hydroperoxide reductase OsmC/OhrA